MLDLHTHILPAMDDGSRDVEETLQLLEEESRQGVTRLVLTPHFYPHREDPDRFLSRRARCFAQMESAADYKKAFSGKVYLGAEVAYFEGISRVEGIERLCIGNTNALLVEMPFCRWNDRVLRDLEILQKSASVQPILAHIERFLEYQPAGLVEELVDDGILMQVNASFFQRFSTKRKAIKMLDRGLIHFIGSDCHNMHSRKPNMGDAMQVISKKLGKDALGYLAHMERTLLEGTR